MAMRKEQAVAKKLQSVGSEKEDGPDEAPRSDLSRVVHLLRRAALTLNSQDPVVQVLRQVVETVLRDRSLADSSLHSIALVADALALDPHAVEAERYVRAALNALDRERSVGLASR